MSLTKIRKDLYEIPFEIMQLEKEIEEELKSIILKRKRLKYLYQKLKMNKK